MTEPRPVYHARRWSRITADESATIQRLYEEGLTHAEIGAAVGRPRQTVTAHLARLDLHVPIPVRRPEKIRRGALAWYEKGVRVDLIARQFGVTANRVHRWRAAAGIPPRYPRMSAAQQRRKGAAQ